MTTLPQTWRADAATFRRYGADGYATLLEAVAADLEAQTREHVLASLTLEEAVAESGYSYSALQKKVASRELQNVGSKASPRVVLGQLPRKGGSHDEAGGWLHPE